VAEALERRDLLATFTVVTTGDTGAGSLRQAILSANATPGADTIAFNLGAGGVQRINVASSLPAITETLTVDGRTQPGYAGAPIVEVIGPNTNSFYSEGFRIQADGCVLRGLAIDGFLERVYVTSNKNVIAGNYIGITAAGQNITNPNDAGTGLRVGGEDNVIGGTVADARNVISGNHNGMVIYGARNVAAGNYVGTDPSGTSVIGNVSVGVYFFGEQTVLGGTVAAARNVISGNGTGVTLESGSANAGFVQGNYIGTDVTGTKALPNFRGVFLDGLSVTIGGDTPGARNVIAGNVENGIQMSKSAGGNHRVLGNFIGVAADGVTPLGNGGYGVIVSIEGKVQVGGRATGEGNVIANNGKAGVAVTGPASGVVIAGNSIFANVGLPIDLGVAGPTPNDALDADTGPNTLQNYPLLAKPSNFPSGTRVSGVLPSTPGVTFTIDFYDNSPGGQVYLGSTTVVTDAAGNGSFDFNLATPIAPGHTISATATGGSTSEFSAGVYLPLPGDANRDGVVNFDDLLILAKNYNGSPRTWDTGDFTGDGVVNFDDLLILAKNYNRTADAAPPVAMAQVSAVTAGAVVAAPVRPVVKEKAKPVFAAKPASKPAPAPKRAPVRRNG
jgi:hypothetical protein